MKLVVIGCLCAGALAAVGCADGGLPTSPSASAAVSGAAATASGLEGATSQSASPRHGDLQVAKECSGYTGGAGSFCTITSSSLKAIEVDSKILYLQPELLFTPQGSDVVLDLPGPGNNTAYGNCSLDVGVCTFSGGTGKFSTFQARVDVSYSPDDDLWHWEGTYSFSPQD
jgi:hypothetical protein